MALDPVHRTAFAAAWARAAHLRFDGEPKVFEDVLALDLTAATEGEFLEWLESYRAGPLTTAPWVLRARAAPARPGWRSRCRPHASPARTCGSSTSRRCA